MTVEDLFGILSKDVVFSVYESGSNKILFESNNTYLENNNKIWEDIKGRKIFQISPTDHGEVYIYINPKFLKEVSA